MHGIDIGRKLTRSELATVRARGMDFIVRYLDGTRGQSSKSINGAEVAAALGEGLGIALVFQTTGQGPFTYEQGRAHGQAARDDALALGYPLHLPIYFALDRDLLTAEIPGLVHYANGIDAGLAGDYENGLYGEYDVIVHARKNWPGVERYWQTYAWSSGQVYFAADLFQHANGFTLAPGLVVDLNFARTPVRWRIGRG